MGGVVHRLSQVILCWEGVAHFITCHVVCPVHSYPQVVLRTMGCGQEGDRALFKETVCSGKTLPRYSLALLQ